MQKKKKRKRHVGWEKCILMWNGNVTSSFVSLHVSDFLWVGVCISPQLNDDD